MPLDPQEQALLDELGVKLLPPDDPIYQQGTVFVLPSSETSPSPEAEPSPQAPGFVAPSVVRPTQDSRSISAEPLPADTQATQLPPRTPIGPSEPATSASEPPPAY